MSEAQRASGAPRRDITILLLVGLLAAVVIGAFWIRGYEPGRAAPTFDGCARRIVALRERFEAIKDVTDPDLARAADIIRVQIDYLRQRLSGGGYGEQVFIAEDPTWRMIPRVEADIDAVKSGRNPFKHRRGKVIRGYTSAIDGNVQPYRLAVPKSYRPGKSMPLMVSLHGFSWPSGSAPSVRELSSAIVLAPYGRDSTDFMHVGEEDVFDAIEDVAKDYDIDRRRIYLTGRSMGGTGCWWLASRYPDRFAAIAPAQGKAGHPPNPLPAEGPLKPVNKLIRSSLAPAVYAENFLHVPNYILHGTYDAVNSVQHSRLMRNRLEQLRGKNAKRHPDAPGYFSDYWEFPGFKHDPMPLFAWQTVVDEMLKHRVDLRPSHVHYKTDSLRYRKAYWVEIDRMTEQMSFATIDADVKGNELRVETDNIAGFSVDTRSCPLPGSGAKARIDDESVDIPADSGRKLHFVRRDGAWAFDADAGPAAKAHLPGPLEDAFRTPFMIIYGTQGEQNKAMRRAVKREALVLAELWWQRYHSRPELKSDEEAMAAPDELKKHSLILFGGPETNYVTLKLGAGLPVEVSDSGVKLAGRSWKGSDIGLKMCAPHPENPRRYVVLIAASGPEGMYQINTRFGNWFDWFVYANRNWYDYAVFDAAAFGPDSLLAVGFFDQDWQLDTEQQWNREEKPEKWPRIRPSVVEGSMYLSERWPASLFQLKGPVTFDTSLSGEKLAVVKREKCEGERSPEGMTYDVPEWAEEFTAAVGFTPSALDGASEDQLKAWELAVEVLLDGETVGEKGRISGASGRKRLRVPVAGAKELELRVTTNTPDATPSAARWDAFGPAWLGRREFEHGLGVRAMSAVTYQVPSGAERFEALVAVDPTEITNVSAAGRRYRKLSFGVLVDGKQVNVDAATGDNGTGNVSGAGPLTVGSPPKKLSVPLNGAKTITLRVRGPSTKRWILPRGIWGEAKFIHNE